MPYIKQEKREDLEWMLEEISEKVSEKGTLTYCIFKLGIEYMKRHPQDYQNLSDTCASMHDAEQEFRRRFLNSYEDEKIISNGDVL